MSKHVSIIEPVLRLDQAHFERVKHQFRITGTWHKVGRKSWEPCLAITPRIRWPGRRIVPVIIPLSSAWKWAMHGEIGDPGHVFAKTAEWFVTGILPGAAGNKRDHMQLLNAINESLPDLITMPPRPRGETATIAEVMIRKDTGEIIEREITNDV